MSIQFHYRYLNLIKCNWIIFIFLFFATMVWGMRLLKDFFYEKLHVLFLPYCDFSTFCWIEKDTHWNFAKIGQNVSPWTLIFDRFVQFWMMSVPKQPPLKLKSAFIMILSCSHPCPCFNVFIGDPFLACMR